jgi:TorA maturation chaperone TorD
LEKATEVNKILGVAPSLKASAGWLKKLELRQDMRQLFIEGEKLSADPAAISAYRQELQKEIAVCRPSVGL